MERAPDSHEGSPPFPLACVARVDVRPNGLPYKIGGGMFGTVFRGRLERSFGPDWPAGHAVALKWLNSKGGGNGGVMAGVDPYAAGGIAGGNGDDAQAQGLMVREAPYTEAVSLLGLLPAVILEPRVLYRLFRDGVEGVPRVLDVMVIDTQSPQLPFVLVMELLGRTWAHQMEEERNFFRERARTAAALRLWMPGGERALAAEGDPRLESMLFPAAPQERARDGVPWPHVCLDVPRVVYQLGKLLRTLAEAHRRGIMHLDIKRDNILLRGDLEPVLGDWGVASVREYEDQPLRPQVFATAYRAPELLLGATHYDARVDVYALGVVMVQWLTTQNERVDTEEEALRSAWERFGARPPPPSPGLRRCPLWASRGLPAWHHVAGAAGGDEGSCAPLGVRGLYPGAAVLERLLKRMVHPNPEDRASAAELLGEFPWLAEAGSPADIEHALRSADGDASREEVPEPLRVYYDLLVGPFAEKRELRG